MSAAHYSGGANRKRPLSDLRVLDFTWGGAGPLLTKTMADYGADVVKVESAAVLDFPRTLPPFAAHVSGLNRSAYFTNRNSSKRSLNLDLRSPEARDLALRLASKADIVVNNFRSLVMESFGLSYRDVRAVNRAVIYLSMPMTPSSGPTAGFRGVGRTISGFTGIHRTTGYSAQDLTGPGTHFPDHAANPGHGLVAVLAALYGRRQTGRGACIELAQVHSTLQLLGPAILASAASGIDPVPSGNKVDEAIFSEALEATDGWFVLTLSTDDDVKNLSELVSAGSDGVPQILSSRADAAGWVHLDEESCERILQWAKRRTRHEAVASLHSVGIVSGPVEDAKGVATDYPELWKVGHLKALDHPEMGQAVYNAPPVRSRQGGEPCLRRAPLFGEHTEDVLGEWLGLSGEDVDGYRSLGALQ